MSLSVLEIRITNSYILRWAKIEPSKKCRNLFVPELLCTKCGKYCPVTITFKGKSSRVLNLTS